MLLMIGGQPGAVPVPGAGYRCDPHAPHPGRTHSLQGKRGRS